MCSILFRDFLYEHFTGKYYESGGLSRPAWSQIRHRAKRKLWRVAGNSLRSANEESFNMTWGHVRSIEAACQLPKQAAESTDAHFCIAKELTPKAMNQTFCIFSQTHPKTRQNQLREILFVLRQKYTWTSLIFFLDFPGVFLDFPWG